MCYDDIVSGLTPRHNGRVARPKAEVNAHGPIEKGPRCMISAFAFSRYIPAGAKLIHVLTYKGCALLIICVQSVSYSL